MMVVSKAMHWPLLVVAVGFKRVLPTTNESTSDISNVILRASPSGHSFDSSLSAHNPPKVTLYQHIDHKKKGTNNTPCQPWLYNCQWWFDIHSRYNFQHAYKQIIGQNIIVWGVSARRLNAHLGIWKLEEFDWKHQYYSRSYSRMYSRMYYVGSNYYISLIFIISITVS